MLLQGSHYGYLQCPQTAQFCSPVVRRVFFLCIYLFYSVWTLHNSMGIRKEFLLQAGFSCKPSQQIPSEPAVSGWLVAGRIAGWKDLCSALACQFPQPHSIEQQVELLLNSLRRLSGLHCKWVQVCWRLVAFVCRWLLRGKLAVYWWGTQDYVKLVLYTAHSI